MIGMGHVIRCIALAEILNKKYKVVFAIQDTDKSVFEKIEKVAEVIKLKQQKIDKNDAKQFLEFVEQESIVVLDGYNFNTNYQKIIKEKGCKLVCIDDLHNVKFCADAVINHAVSGIEKKYKTNKGTKLYCGLKYSLMRKEFRNVPVKRKPPTRGSVLIAMGGSDVNDHSYKVAKQFSKRKDIKKIGIIAGNLNPNLKALESLKKKCASKGIKYNLLFNLNAGDVVKEFSSNQYCVLSASGMAIEALACGIKPIIIKTASNQKDFYKYALKNKIAVKYKAKGSEDSKPGEQNKKIQMQIKNSPKAVMQIFDKL